MTCSYPPTHGLSCSYPSSVSIQLGKLHLDLTPSQTIPTKYIKLATESMHRSFSVICPHGLKRYETIAAHTRRRASVLVVFVVFCVHMYSFAGLIRWKPPPTFSDTAITDRHSDTTRHTYLIKFELTLPHKTSFKAWQHILTE